MNHLLKASGFVLCQASKSWKQALRDVFCCQPHADTFISPHYDYSTFADKDEFSSRFDTRAPLTPSSSQLTKSSITSGDSEPTCSRSSSGDHQLINGGEIERKSESPELLSAGESWEQEDKIYEHVSITQQPAVRNQLYGQCRSSTKISLLSGEGVDGLLARQQPFLSYSAPAGLNYTDASFSKVSTKSLIPNRSLHSGMGIVAATNGDGIDGMFAVHGKCTERIVSLDARYSTSREEPEGCSDVCDESLTHSMDFDNARIMEDSSVVNSIESDQDLLVVVDKSTSPQEVLDALRSYKGILTPELTVACIHHIYAKNCMLHEHNSEAYNQMCGIIIKDKEFRHLLAILEHNAQLLNNFALLTAASDLLLLRLTLRKKTISTLLSNVDVEKLTLEELRLLSSCLHTPNIPLVNSEYFYNVAASVAMQEVQNIEDLYTLLNIMKCFGRYFTMDAKRQCEGKVRELSGELWNQWPDGRSKAAHMFDAFYRMEHAPSRTLLQSATDVIVNSDIAIQPQDISAIFRYCVKYGYGFQDVKLLDKLCSELHQSLETDRASQFTTNVKWLTVFYYYNEAFMRSFVDCVKRDMHDLDFVALSDVLDALAQVYYTPDDADEFFDRMYCEMLNKLPTLTTSHVHNAKRKLLLTAFHFAVYGRYPAQLIQIALSESQLSMHMGHSGTRQFLIDLCRAVSVERPDLLPKCLPMHLLQNHGRPKLYAFEKDVQNVLLSICCNDYFHLMMSPACFFPFFLLQLRLDGTMLPIRNPGFVPAHRHQMVQNVAVIPLPRSRFCLGSKHAIGKTRLVLRLLRAQGARVITIPHYDWDSNSFEYKQEFLKDKIFNQKADDAVE